jgi:folate-binding protein YgfZ
MTVRYLDLSARGRIRVSGEDRKRLLHAMSTNHVEQMESGQGLYAFFLNAQGRILSDAVLLCEDDTLLLCLEPETREKIFQHLDKFIIADDAALDDVTDSTSELAVEGDGAIEVLSALGLAIPRETYHFARTGAVLTVRLALTAPEGFRLIVSRDEAPAWMERLDAAGASPISPEEFEAARIRFGTPRYGHEIAETNLLQETGLLHAAHFSKGCYLGQEIVERVRARGHVNRTLVHLRLAASVAPEPGTAVLAGEKEVGTLTSAARADNAVYGFAYVRVEAQRDPSQLRVAGAPVELLTSGPPR